MWALEEFRTIFRVVGLSWNSNYNNIFGFLLFLWDLIKESQLLLNKLSYANWNSLLNDLSWWVQSAWRNEYIWIMHWSSIYWPWIWWVLWLIDTSVLWKKVTFSSSSSHVIYVNMYVMGFFKFSEISELLQEYESLNFQPHDVH